MVSIRIQICIWTRQFYERICIWMPMVRRKIQMSPLIYWLCVQSNILRFLNALDCGGDLWKIYIRPKLCDIHDQNHRQIIDNILCINMVTLPSVFSKIYLKKKIFYRFPYAECICNGEALKNTSSRFKSTTSAQSARYTSEI